MVTQITTWARFSVLKSHARISRIGRTGLQIGTSGGGEEIDIIFCI